MFSLEGVTRSRLGNEKTITRNSDGNYFLPIDRGKCDDFRLSRVIFNNNYVQQPMYRSDKEKWIWLCTNILHSFVKILKTLRERSRTEIL